MTQLLQKKQLIDTAYEVQFFISGNDYFQKYRVKGKDGKIYLLKFYNSSKLSLYQFGVIEYLMNKDYSENIKIKETDFIANLSMPEINELKSIDFEKIK